LIILVNNPTTEGLVSAHLNRRFSRPLAKLLARTPITPNQISFLSFIVAIGSFLLFLTGHNVWAGIVAQTSSVLDGVDGDLAHIKNMKSSFGGFFDAILDRYSDFAILGGLTFWALQFEPRFENVVVITAGLAATVGSFMISYSRARAEVSFGKPFPGLMGSLASRDARLLIVMIGSIVGHGTVTLVFLGAITNLVVVWRVFGARKGLE
jgi:CDP-L-myo-inositol myo-inositolphosphotransferase